MADRHAHLVGRIPERSGADTSCWAPVWTSGTLRPSRRVVRPSRRYAGTADVRTWTSSSGYRVTSTWRCSPLAHWPRCGTGGRSSRRRSQRSPAYNRILGDQAVFQIEVPIELILLTKLPPPAHPLLSRLFGKWIAALAAAWPSGRSLEFVHAPFAAASRAASGAETRLRPGEPWSAPPSCASRSVTSRDLGFAAMRVPWSWAWQFSMVRLGG